MIRTHHRMGCRRHAPVQLSQARFLIVAGNDDGQGGALDHAGFWPGLGS